nr:glycosyltransferase [Allomuricauda sp.]
MRILHVINSLGAGGAEKLITEVLIQYQKRGLDVGVLLLKNSPTPLLEQLIRHEIPIHGFGATNNMYSPLNIFKIKPLLKQYDLIHVHLFPSSYLTVFASFFGKSAPIVFTEHNTTNKRRNIKLLKPLERFVYNKFDRVITISDAVHDNLQQHLGNSFTKLTKIYNGINLEEIKMAKPLERLALGFTENDVLLLQVSSFTPQKNQKTLIESLKHLPQNVKLLLVGDGPLRKETEDFAKSENIGERVFFLGLRSDVPSLLQTVDMVILSSHYEGLSLSSVEGLASGKPFIASDVPGLSEVVINAGLLFPNNDAKALSSKIIELLENPAHAQKIVSRCQKRAQDFNIDTMVDNYLKLYRRLTGREK